MAEENQVSVTDDPQDAGCARLVLRGRVTVQAAQQLYQAALGLSARAVGVNVCCEDAEYLDGSALQILACLRNDLKMRGKPFRLSGARNALPGLFRLAGLENLTAACA